MKTLATLLLTLNLIGCVGGEKSSSSRTRGSVANNAASTLSIGYGRILEDNPIILSKNSSLAAAFDVGALLQSSQQFISTNGSLTSSCSSPDGLFTITNCYKVLENSTALPLTPINGKWSYSPGSVGFWQVHTFGHMKRSVEKFQSELSTAYTLSQSLGAGYKTSISASLYSNYAFWFDQMVLTAYSHSGKFQNAFFEPSTYSLHFGVDPENVGMIFAQDPTIIYHEIGHSYVYTMMNQRTMASAAPLVTKRVDFGSLGYDEAGAINEGIADYESYVMNQRTHMGEWALGRFFKQSRALEESDTIYGPGISTDSDSRLSYPQYINFDPNNPTEVTEDIHYGGQITSHFLVALTKELKSKCNQTHAQATANVRFLLAETLGELGDLTSKASQNFVEDHNVNMIDGDAAHEWARISYPPNYRRFFQYFAKHLVTVFTTVNGCSTGNLTQDRIEQLLDEYGLLLFKTYNNNGNGYKAAAVTQPGHDLPLTSVSAINRVRSILIPKSYISYDTSANSAKAFVIDSAEQIGSIVSSLKASGQTFDFSSLIPSDLGYNNNNGKINPGEIVGVALNLFNKANTPMGGIQVLANDWDHAKMSGSYLKMCPNFEDNFPLASENAASLTGDLSTTAGDCRHITKENGEEAAEYLAPVCFVQYRDTNETKWVSQDYFRYIQGLNSAACLDPDDTQDCYIRVVQGADHAFFSKIDGNKSYLSTMNQGSSSTPTFQSSNLILFEVNENIPEGTTFDCRFRVRFSNCDDCYHDPDKANYDDYLDYEYAGARPFKLLHLQFTVIP